MKTLMHFTQTAILKTIGYKRLALLLKPFLNDLAALAIVLPDHGPNDYPGTVYFHALAKLFGSPLLPQSARACLADIERLAAPENAKALGLGISQHLPNVSFASKNWKLHAAMELWFTHPEVFLQLLPPPEPNGEKISASSDQTPSLPLSPTCDPSLSPISTVSLNPQPSSIPQLSTLNPQLPSVPQPSTLNPQLSSVPQLSTLNPQLSSVPQLSTLNSQLSTPNPPETDEASFSRLALLSPAQYDRVRKQEARRLKIRPRTLDEEVARAQSDLAESEANNIKFDHIEPWPEPVNGAEVMCAVSARFTHWLVLPTGAADCMSIWSAHPHFLEAFTHTPRLNLCAPEPGCGKTTALDIIATFVPRPMATESLNAAVLFRGVAKYHPTLLLDEVDTYIFADEELRALLNAGHKSGACAYRCEGGRIRAFAAYAAAALAGIGAIPATLYDRSIVVHMLKARPGEIPALFDRRDVTTETELASKIARWAQDNLPAVRAADPPLPAAAYNRLRDNWRPLFAIAHVLGGDWPQRILNSFHALTAPTSVDAIGINVALLHDLRQIFLASAAERLPSRELIDGLLTLPGRPWPEAHKGNKPITETWLAHKLAPFGITPKLIRIDNNRFRGYDFAAFVDAFERYLKPLS